MVLVTAYHLTVQSRTGLLFGLLLPGAAPACMAQGVVYADLKFATAPPVTTPTCPTAPDEDDSPYENLPLGPVPTVPSPGRWPRRWRIPRRLLAASLLVLLVLLVVAAVSLGACYWQVTQSLQAASREHAAEQGRLSQEVSAREQSLEQTRVELAWARAELQRAWQEGNSSQKELGSRDAELGRARQELTVLQQETQELRGALRDSNSTVNILRACVNTDCCPSGWVLYRSKCLFISMQKTTWFESSEDCRKKSAHLLVQGSWPSWTVPDFTQQYGARYWVGDTYWNTYNDRIFCRCMFSGKISSYSCSRPLPWICEKPPDLSSPSKPLNPLSAKR